MMKPKKNKIANIDSIMIDIVEETKQYTEQEQEQFFSADLFSNFPFNVEKSKIQFLRNFVNGRRKADPVRYFHFTNTDAVRMGIEMLKEKYSTIQQRPKTVRISTRAGNHGRLNGIEKMKTSFSLNEVDRNFIYNVIYHHSVDGTDYGKAEFFDELIQELETVK